MYLCPAARARGYASHFPRVLLLLIFLLFVPSVSPTTKKSAGGGKSQPRAWSFAYHTLLISLTHAFLLFFYATGLQGGPHNHTITALATALKQAKAPEYVAYQKQVGLKKK